MKTSLFLLGLMAGGPVFAGGGGCAETCALSEAPDLQSETEFRATLSDWMSQEEQAASLPLETLLFYSGSTLHFLASLDDLTLSADRRRFLKNELARTKVTMEMRLVSDSGDVRGTVLAADVPLGEKQHLRFQATGSLGHLESGGRVRRVGLNHIWSRW